MIENLEQRLLMSASLSPTIARSTLAANVVAGGTSHGLIGVEVQNTGSATETGTMMTAIYASQDGQIDSSSTLIGSTTSKPTIAAGKMAVIVVIIKSVPATLLGQYSLLAQVTDPNGTKTNSAVGPTLTAAAPFLAFSDTLVSTTLPAASVSGQKTAATAKIKITNNGNVTASGSSTIALYLSTDTNAADGTLIRPVSLPLALRVNGSRIVVIPLQSLPSVSANNYNVIVQVTDPKGNITSASSSNRYDVAAPFISLTPQILSFTPTQLSLSSTTDCTIKISLTNNGNITAGTRGDINDFLFDLRMRDQNVNYTAKLDLFGTNTNLLGPGKTMTETIRFPLELALFTPQVPAGSYTLFMNATLDSPSITETATYPQTLTVS